MNQEFQMSYEDYKERLRRMVKEHEATGQQIGGIFISKKENCTGATTSEFLEYHSSLDPVSAAEAGTIGRSGGNSVVQAVSLCSLGVDHILELLQILGCSSDKFLLKCHL